MAGKSPSAKASSSRSPRSTTKITTKKGKSAPAPVVVAPLPLSDDEDDDGFEDVSDSDQDEDDDGVDEEGMQRLMKALGDEPLDEYGQAQFNALVDGSGSEDEDEDQDEDGASVSTGSDEDEALVDDDSEKEDEEDGDATEEEAILFDEVIEVDQDAVPKQKVEIDDHVRFFSLSDNQVLSLIYIFGSQVAMRRIRENIRLDASLPWTETLVLSYPETIDADVDDDLKRELALYVRFFLLPFSFPELTPSPLATNKPSTPPPPPVRSPPSTTSPSLVPPTTSPKWSSPTRIWSESVNDFSTKARVSRRVKIRGRRERGRSSGNRYNSRRSRRGSRARRRWRRG